MQALQEQSHIQQPSAQVLDRIQIDEMSRTVPAKNMEFNPDSMHQAPSSNTQSLEQITGDFGKSATFKFLYLMFAVLFVAGCMLGMQTYLYGYQYVQNGKTDSIYCSNPTSFDIDGQIKCSTFNFNTNPQIGMIVKTDSFNQYLLSRFIITRPTLKYQFANFIGKYSIYSLQQTGDKLNPYIKKDSIVQYQKITQQVQTKTLSYNYYSKQDRGFVVPLELIRPITEKAYMIVSKFDSIQMGYLQTSEISLTAEYTPQQTLMMIFATKIVCVVFIAISCFIFKWYINSTQGHQTSLSNDTKHQQRVLLYFGLTQLICLDPLSPLTMIKPNIFSDILSSLFLTVQLTTFVLLANYFLHFYTLKQFMTKRQMFVPSIIVFVMTGVYSFATTFLQWKQSIPVQQDIIEFILALIVVIPLLYPISHGFNLLLSHKQYQTRHLGFYFFTSGILLILVGSVARFYYRVYAIEMVSIVVPVMITTYIFCIQFFFKAYSLQQQQQQEQVMNEEQMRQRQLQNQRRSSQQSYNQNVLSIEQNNKQQNKENLDYFDIDQKTEQFQQRSVNADI